MTENTQHSPGMDPHPPTTGSLRQVHAARVSITGLDKSYGSNHVLKGIDLEIFPGQVTCILGDNGAGKSTLMGRILYELGIMDEKRRVANERASGKIGKSSFSWAWEFDGTTEERERWAIN